MPERLRDRDVALLALESARSPMHVGTLHTSEPPPGGFEYDRLVGLIADRIGFVPRFRQRLRDVPGRLGNPVWVDDPAFDLTFHVRRSALPRPGTLEQLRDLTTRIMSRRLDRTRPLWETYLVEGLAGGRFAILTKSHHVLVDGATVDLGQLILDDSPRTRVTPEVAWAPDRGRGGVELVADVLAESTRSPRAFAGTVRGRLTGAGRVVGTTLAGIPGIPAIPGIPGRTAVPEGPLSARGSEQRRLATVDTRLAAFREVRRAHGGTVNDVVLATIAGALRSWLLTRAEPVRASTKVRALVPLSVVDDEFAEPTSLGSQLTPHLLDLPVGEPSPMMRLHQVSYSLKAHAETGRAVSAAQLAGLTGFAPTTFHALGSRLAARHPARSFHLLITNAPGPQFPLYAAGSQMLASYPVLPLPPGHALAIGATSYDGIVYFGIDADRDAVPDVDVLAQCVVEALDELVEASSAARSRAPRGRLTPPATSLGAEES
jgi:diacylglycerol O-acyltransferase